MALKPYRYVVDDCIDYFWGASTATRGGVASLVTSGSGEAMDNSSAVVGYVTAPSGAVPIGVLMNDVVSIDQTRQHLNQHKDEVQVNSKVTLMKRGVVVTNMIAGTPAAGDRAYLTGTGIISNTQPINEAPIVGRFLSIKDQNGYAKVHIDLPAPTLDPPLTAAGVGPHD